MEQHLMRGLLCLVFLGLSMPTVFAANNGTKSNFANWKTNSSRDLTSWLADAQFLSATDLRTSPSAPWRRAGIVLSPTWACRDVRGRPCWLPPDIGAYQATSGDLATTRSLRP